MFEAWSSTYFIVEIIPNWDIHTDTECYTTDIIWLNLDSHTKLKKYYTLIKKSDQYIISKEENYGYLKATFLSSRFSSRICAFFLNCLFSPTSQGWWWPPGKFCQQRRISEGSLRRSQPWRMYSQQIFHLAFSFWYFVQIMLPVILTFFSVTIKNQNFELVTWTLKSLRHPPWEAEQRWWCTWTKLGSCPSLQW